MDINVIKSVITETKNNAPFYGLTRIMNPTNDFGVRHSIEFMLLRRFTRERYNKETTDKNYIHGANSDYWHEFLRNELAFITENVNVNEEILTTIDTPFQFNENVEITYNDETFFVAAIRENGALVMNHENDLRSRYNLLHLDTDSLNIIREAQDMTDHLANPLPDEVETFLTENYDPDKEGNYNESSKLIEGLNSLGYTSNFGLSGELDFLAKLDCMFTDLDDQYKAIKSF